MIKRLLYRSYRLSATLGYWMERRFTRAGALVATAAIITAGLGVNIEQSVAYQASALLVCLIVVAMLTAPFFRMRFEARRILPKFGTVGEKLRYQVVLTNRGDKNQQDLWYLEELADLRLNYQEFLDLIWTDSSAMSLSFRMTQSGKRYRSARFRDHAVPDLPVNEQVTFPISVVPLKRGYLRLQGITLARTDPFGLFKAYAKIRHADSILILPKRYPIPEISLSGSPKYQQLGVELASSVGESEEFIALRDYRRGDPLRHIHWKSWAKTGRPIVKEFQDEFFIKHALILDTFSPRDPGDQFEEAVSVAASFACTLQTQESLLDLMFIGPEAYCITAGRGLGHTEQLLEILAAVQVCRDKPVSTLERLVRNHLDALSGCVCILLDWDRPRQKLVQLIRQSGVPLRVMIICDNQNRKALDLGPLKDDPGSLQSLRVGHITEDLTQSLASHSGV